MVNTMKKIILAYILLALCFQMVACNPQPATILETKAPAVPPYRDAVTLNLEDIRDTEDYMKARQVPIGQVVISEKLKKALLPYDSETLFKVGVSYAAMIPKHVTVGLPDWQVYGELSRLAKGYIESLGIEIGIHQEYYDYFDIYATKDQIMQIRCGPDAALYIFGCPDTF